MYSMLVRKIVRVVFATMVDGFRRLSLKMDVIVIDYFFK